METGGAALPEFEMARGEGVATPEGREGNDGAFGELFEEFGFALGEDFAVGDFATLSFGDPGTDLGKVGTGVKIGFRLFARGLRNSSLNADLAFEFFPEDGDRGLWVGGEVLAFARVVVRVEVEAGGVGSFEEDGAGGGLARRVDRGKSHRVGLDDSSAEGLVEPVGELVERGVGDGVEVELALFIVLAQVGKVDGCRHVLFLRKI